MQWEAPPEGMSTWKGGSVPAMWTEPWYEGVSLTTPSEFIPAGINSGCGTSLLHHPEEALETSEPSDESIFISHLE